MTTDRSYGCVPVYRQKGTDMFLLVRHDDGHWGFPKGHPEGVEDPLETARRELLEECGIAEIEILPDYSFSETYVFPRNGESVQKTNTFFLGFVHTMATRAQEGEIAECRFVSHEESLSMDLFPDTRRILVEAGSILASIPQVSD